ncbi:hypothetical protein Tco_1498695 [Tanacetum coccineum]
MKVRIEASVDKLFKEGGSGSHAEHGDSVSGGHDVGILQVGVVALPILPFLTSSVSVTPELEDGGQTDFMAGVNLQTITAPPRPSAPLMTMTTASTVDPTTTAKEKFVESSIFGGGSSSGAEHTIGGFSGPDTDLQKVYIPQWSVTNGSCLDDGRTCREMVDEFAPPKFFASIRSASLKAQLLVKEAEATEAIRLRAEVQTLADRNTILEGEKSELDVKVANLAATVKVREQEVADLDVVVASVKVHNDNLSDQVHTLEVSSAGLQEKVTAFENFIELAITKCLNSTEYLSTLGLAIGKAIKKGMLEGLSAGITYDTAGRVLTDIAAYNPSAEADCLFALQRL